MLQYDFLVSGSFSARGETDEYLYEAKTTGSLFLHDGGHEVRVGGLGSEWALRGVGDYLGDGKDQILIENTSGWLVTGEVNHGVMTYHSLGGLGPEWSFVGTKDYLNNGHDEFMIQNTHGLVAVGDAAAQTWGVSYTLIEPAAPVMHSSGLF